MGVKTLYASAFAICFAVNPRLAAAAGDQNTPAVDICTGRLAPTDATVAGVLVTAQAQRLVIFAILVIVLLRAITYAREQVAHLSAYIGTEARPSAAGRPVENFQGLVNSFKRWGKRWWLENSRPIELIARAALSGYALPLVVFGVAALYFSWLFPGEQLLLSASSNQCPGRAGDVIEFLAKQFWGAASLGVSDILYAANPEPTLSHSKTANGFAVAFRFFVVWAGSLSLAQMLGQVAFRRFENLLLGAWYRLSKFVRRIFRGSCLPSGRSCHSYQPDAGITARRRLNASRNIGFVSTVSARALNVAGTFFSGCFHQNGTRPHRTCSSANPFSPLVMVHTGSVGQRCHRGCMLVDVCGNGSANELQNAWSSA